MLMLGLICRNRESRHHTIKGTFLFWSSAVNTPVMFLLFALPARSVHFPLFGRHLHVALVVFPNIIPLRSIKVQSILVLKTQPHSTVKGDTLQNNVKRLTSVMSVFQQPVLLTPLVTIAFSVHLQMTCSIWREECRMLSMYCKNRLSWDFCEFQR